VIFRARHLQEDRLFECYLAEQGGEPIEPPAAEHLTDCTDCNARYADLRRFMDGLRTEADAELDEIFPQERMRAQQQHIARRVEQLGRHARVISFPGYRPAQLAPGWRSHVAPRWIGAAAAAGLAMGIGLGSVYYSHAPGGAPQTVAINSIAQSVNAPAVASAPAILSDVNEAFLSELELALERPRTQELVALDELTPHVREIRVQLR
jgi:anti-sigma factor RsiW